MKKLLIILFLTFFSSLHNEAFAFIDYSSLKNLKEEYAVKRVLNSQVRWANKYNFAKFISTFDKSYVNDDGFDYETYSKLIEDIWSSYNNIKYAITIKDIKITGENATVNLVEISHAKLQAGDSYEGYLKSESDTIYYLRKISGKWKVVSDKILEETTSMMYGDASNLDVKLSVPEDIEPNKDYTATLEFKSPLNTVAVASLVSEQVEYPKKQAEEVFRVMPEDNILERIFTSNSNNRDEYIVASIGLTKPSLCEMDIKLSLIGFGYKIKRVNVQKQTKETVGELDDKK